MERRRYRVHYGVNAVWPATEQHYSVDDDSMICWRHCPPCVARSNRPNLCQRLTFGWHVRHRRNFGTRFTMSNDVAISTICLAILSDMIQECDGRPDRQTKTIYLCTMRLILDQFWSILISLCLWRWRLCILTLCKVCLNRDFFIIAATNVSRVTETADLVR